MDHQAKAATGENRQQRIAQARSAMGAALVDLAKAERARHGSNSNGAGPKAAELLEPAGRGTSAGQDAAGGQ